MDKRDIERIEKQMDAEFDAAIKTLADRLRTAKDRNKGAPFVIISHKDAEDLMAVLENLSAVDFDGL